MKMWIIKRDLNNSRGKEQIKSERSRILKKRYDIKEPAIFIRTIMRMKIEKIKSWVNMKIK